MKNILSGICLIFFSASVSAQGLEKIIVEKYYVSDAKDATASSGHLPEGSVTYRIYADMLPGYKFQAAYGVPGHELRLVTTTLFFNNEDYGNIIPNVIPKQTLKNNTVMLDSWLSIGGASESNFGILKSDDDSVDTVVNEKSFLQNDDTSAGIPIKKRDGLIAGTPERVTAFMIDTAIAVFNKYTNGNLFLTSNGSWACLNGATGPTNDNRVLIAQITTDGIFSFELNIQIGRPDGGVENYVAKNPSEKEVQLPSLSYTSPPANASPKAKAKTPLKK